MSKDSSRSRLLSRLGMLATTLAMGAALIVSSVISYLGVRDASRSLLEARSFDLAMALHRELRFGGQDGLAALHAELAPQGVRYLAIMGERGRLLASFGTSTCAAEVIPPPPRGPLPVRWQAHGEVVRVAIDLCGRGRHHAPRLGCGQGVGRLGVIEFEPKEVNGVLARALLTLVMSVLTASLLVAFAFIAWRKTLYAARLGQALARDQRLKMLGQMSATLSHELRNPLTALKGHAQLVLEKLGQEDAARRGTERVLAEALRLEALADQVLDLARFGTVTAREESVRATIEAALAALDEHHASLTVDDEVATWSFDRPRIEQLLANLIKNARQASPPGAEIEIAARRAARGLSIEVRDFGGGINAGDEARIFEPFYTRRVQGTGLGLAIAKQIAEAHGGDIEAANHPEGGAMFQVTLPPGGDT